MVSEEAFTFIFLLHVIMQCARLHLYRGFFSNFLYRYECFYKKKSSENTAEKMKLCASSENTLRQYEHNLDIVSKGFAVG
jgi:hypothetical protein